MNNNNVSIFNDLAQTYHEYDLSIIPCHGKKPAINKWSDYCKRRPTDTEIAAWSKKYNGNTGISIPMGEANNLIAVDFDYEWPDDVARQPKDITKEDFEVERIAIEKMVLSLIPNTPCKKIGKPGKWTAFFRPNCIAKTFSITRRGLTVFDILYTGKHTVIPPSIHPDTKKPYTWVGQDIISSLDLLPELNLADLEKYGREIELRKESNGNEKTFSGRNNLLSSACYGLFKRGFTVKNAVVHLLEIDQEKNEPHLFSDESEFPKTYKTPEKSARVFAKSNYKSFKEIVFSEPNHNARVATTTTSDDAGGEFKPEQIGYYYLYLIPKADGGIKKVYVPQYELMANDTFDSKQMCFDDSQALYFNNKFWEFMSKNNLNNHVWNKNTGVIKPAHLDSFVKSIKSKCYVGDFNFQSTTGKINCDNGIVDVVDGSLKPNTYEHMFKYCLDVGYNKDAKCEQWLNFLNEIFGADKELIKLVQQIFGYVLIGGDPFLHRAFVLHGTGRNGKSTLLDVLRALIGAGSYSTVSMAKLDKEFSIVALDGKLANIVEETPTDAINAEVFKAMVGGGEVQASHKGFDEFTLRTEARFLFACNDMPVFKDKSVGLSDRLVFIPFNRYFTEDERDTSIKQKLMAELSGILAWSVEGAKDMAKNKSMIIPQKCLDTKEIYKKESDSIYAWFEDALEVNAKGVGLALNDLYTKYHYWCDNEGYKPYGKRNFSIRLRTMIDVKCKDINIKLQSPDNRFSSNGSQIRGYKNLVYKSSIK